jgi:hypothetical protein
MKKLFLLTMLIFLWSCATNNIDTIIDINSEVWCPEIYTPVCWEIEIQCITTPCDNIKETFSNSCFAKKQNAINIVKGECK